MIVKWSEKNKATYMAQEVRKTLVQGEMATKFAITDFVKGLKNVTKKFWITVYNDIPLENGDRVKLLNIDCIVTSAFQGKKIVQFFVADVDIVKKGETDEQENPEADFDNPYET